MIKNGQLANEANLNAAFASKSGNNSLSGIQSLVHETSGAIVENLQQTINDLLAGSSSLNTRVTALEGPRDNVVINQYIYFGDNWRIGLNGVALVIEKLEGAVWVLETKFNP